MALPVGIIIETIISIPAGIIIFLILGYRVYQRLLRFKLPPGPRPWPIVGNLYNIKPVMFECLAEWAHAYGPVVSLWLGSTLNVIVSNSTLAKKVLKEHDQQLADGHTSRSAAKFSRDGNGLIWADYGPDSVKVRKIFTLELFTPKRLEALRPIRQDEVTAMVESIFNDCTNPENIGKSLLVKKYLGAVAFNSITRLAFGERFVNSEGIMDEQGVEFKAILANRLKLGASLAMAEHIPWLRRLFLLEKDAFAKHRARRDRFTKAIMDKHTQAANASKHHFVDALLSLQEKYDLSEDTIIGLLWDIITAGIDNTAISVEWAMAELIRNPRVQRRAQKELDWAIGYQRVLTEDDFSSLPYLRCVVKEALRLHPPNPLMLPHRANFDFNVGGYDIPKGSNVHINVWAIARDADLWKDPLLFRPERFLKKDVDMKGHDFRLLPFGAGDWVCPGAQLGINLVTSMLGHLLYHFHWRPSDGVPLNNIDMSESPGLVTYMRNALQAVPTPRLTAQSDRPYKKTRLLSDCN